MYFSVERHNILIEECGGICFRFEDKGQAFPSPFPWKPEIKWAVNRGNKYLVSWAVVDEHTKFNSRWARREANRSKHQIEVIHEGSIETDRLLGTLAGKAWQDPMVDVLYKIRESIKQAELQHKHDRDVHAALKLTERYDELSRG